jgi:hypothetical protein
MNTCYTEDSLYTVHTMSKDKSENNSTMAAFRIDADKWNAFKGYASDNNSNPSQLIKAFIDECLGITDNSLNSPPISQNNDCQELSDRIDALENCLMNFFKSNKDDWEHQRQINDALKDQLGFMASFTEDEEVPTPHEHRMKLLEFEEIGLNLDLEDIPQSLTIEDLKIYLEDVIASNKNHTQKTLRQSKKETIIKISRYPHPLGKKWDNNGLNQALSYFGLHWY